MLNRLAQESSPYLLQHADNPVDWYPWNQEALDLAKAQGKPIFLSIGYSACHWCHVMAHESFEDEPTAAIMNEHFINIKVDREERPDLDQIYMSAVQALTGSGGWPMSVFLTPDGAPFHGGTYFPPVPRYNMPSFSDVLRAVSDAWQNRRDELLESGTRLVAQLSGQGALAGGSAGEGLTEETLTAAFQKIRQGFDREHGGWGSAPKFPQPMILEFLLRYHHRTGDKDALQMVSQTLEAMARGGMYDQLGGGFHRYSVDARWLAPHFEKMLYDNAQLARVYLHAWQVTGEPFFRTIIEEILDYVVREMTDPAGGFYSTQDADSEGEEGKFFVWTPAELRPVLGDEADAFMEAYAVTERGNFEGKNILEYVGNLDKRPRWGQARSKLYAVREGRVHPGRDEKVLTSWNGLVLAAFAEAARVLGRDDYRLVAQRNAEFLLSELRQPDGRLLRTWKACPEQDEGTGKAKLNAYLEDYANLIDGLLELYQTTFEARWYTAARELADLVIEHFKAPAGFYDTSDDHETLITRPRDIQDNATPSGNGMAATVLARLSGLSMEVQYAEMAEANFLGMQTMMARYPLGFGQWLTALDYLLARPKEIAIIGQVGAADTQALWEKVTEGFRPHQVVALGLASKVPLLRDRPQLEAKATAYVCQNFVCQRPVNDPAELADLMEKLDF